MKRPKVLSSILLLAILIFNVQAQASTLPGKSVTDVKGMYLGGQISTNGWGLEVKYMINNQFTVKAGFENLKLAYNFNFDENDISYDATFDYKTGGLFLLGDYNFTQNFYVSGGILFNAFNPKLTGSAASDLQYGDISIPASKIGDFSFAISPKMKVSPYGGLGVRSFIGQNKRVVLNFEGGIYYMGPPQIEINATGLLSPTVDPAHGQKEVFENQLEQYKIYPVAKITLAVKLF